MRVLFSGGGTGGHVYPALAVAKELARRDAGHVTLYVGAAGELEETLVPRAGVALQTISGGGLHGVGPVRLLRNLWRLARGFVRAWAIVGRFQPDVTFLTGGYVSVPVALAARLRRCPILVYLPDVEPGRAIKLLSRFATRVAVNVEASRPYLPADKVVVTGYPLRPEFYQSTASLRQASRARFGIPEQAKTVLVFGGSRGARAINRALGEILEPLLAQAHVIHISGRLDAEACRRRRQTLPENVRARYHLFDYLHEMEQALAAADLVVARAGAATLAEFPFFGLPAVLIPYPHAWRYQKVNADYLAERGAAMRLDEAEISSQLWPTIEGLLKDPACLERMAAQARALARPDAATRLVDLLATMIHPSRRNGEGSNHGRH